MNIGLATIAAFLLLLPGVAFIIGVNSADKNVREIVFRNTPAEISYVIFVSLIIHFIISLISLLSHYVFNYSFYFDTTEIYYEFSELSNPDKNFVGFNQIDSVLTFGLGYFIVTSIAGFFPGLIFGRRVRSQTWRWSSFFVKHRWMLNLVEISPDQPVHARVMLKDKSFSLAPDTPAPIYVEGVLQDCYFDSDGTLLYLVFKTFGKVEAISAPRQSAKTTDRDSIDKTPAEDTFALNGLLAPAPDGLFALEGTEIAAARYWRGKRFIESWVDNLSAEFPEEVG